MSLGEDSLQFFYLSGFGTGSRIPLISPIQIQSSVQLLVGSLWDAIVYFDPFFVI